MESSGIAGRVQIAASTRALLPPGTFALEPREVEVKGLGRLTTFLLVDGGVIETEETGSGQPPARATTAPADPQPRSRT
jgi:hypothetical protein